MNRLRSGRAGPLTVRSGCSATSSGWVTSATRTPTRSSGTPAEDRGEGRVDAQEPLVRSVLDGGQGHADRRALERLAEARLADRQRGEHALALAARPAASVTSRARLSTSCSPSGPVSGNAANSYQRPSASSHWSVTGSRRPRSYSSPARSRSVGCEELGDRRAAERRRLGADLAQPVPAEVTQRRSASSSPTVVSGRCSTSSR